MVKHRHKKAQISHGHHNPLSEPARPLWPLSYEPKDAGTSWAALDVNGRLIEFISRNPHARQDPASTTKLMTFYTVLYKMHHGELPHSFLEKHKTDITAMLVHSDNYAAERVAAAADPNKSQWNFSREMTKLANEMGLTHSRFNNPKGYPLPGHYSCAADMARMAFLLKRDFPDHAAWAARLKDGRSAALNTGAQLLTHGIEFGKTGTGDSANGRGFAGYGGKGKHAYAGGTRFGYVAVAAASGEGDLASKRGERNGIILGLAEALTMFSSLEPKESSLTVEIREVASLLNPQTPRFPVNEAPTVDFSNLPGFFPLNKPVLQRK